MDKKVAKVYSGKPGCTCGCRGKYSTSKAQITRVLNIMSQHEKNVGLEDDFKFLDLGDKWLIAYYEEN